MSKEELTFFLLWYIRYSPFITKNINVEHIDMVVDRFLRIDFELEKDYIAKYQAEHFPNETFAIDTK